MRYLVDAVWRSQSILSEARDLAKLVLVRWDPSSPLSPWNCALLTADEADAHVRLPTHDLVYGTAVVKRVQQRHVIAKTHFAALV